MDVTLRSRVLDQANLHVTYRRQHHRLVLLRGVSPHLCFFVVGVNPILIAYRSSAIHSFVFPADPSSTQSTKITTHSTPFPVFEYTPVPGTTDQILLSLDTTFSTVVFNQEAGQRPKKDQEVTLTEEQKRDAKKQFLVLQIGPDASVSSCIRSEIPPPVELGKDTELMI